MNINQLKWILITEKCYSCRRGQRTGVSPFWTGGWYSGSPFSAKLPTNCPIPSTWEIKIKQMKPNQEKITGIIFIIQMLQAFLEPVYGGHFLFSGGGLNSSGGRGSKSFKRLFVRPVGWLCPICIKETSWFKINNQIPAKKIKVIMIESNIKSE